MRNFFKRFLRLRRGKKPVSEASEAEARFARGERLKELRKVMSGKDWLQFTESPSNTDLAFLGAFIQAYCVADFNARRTVNVLRAISLGDESDFASKLNDVDVIVHLRNCAADWTGTLDVSDGIRKAADILELHREHRHNFAHWVVRRMKNEDVFVMVTKNAMEAKKRDGVAQGIDEAKWGLVTINGLKGELKKLLGHGNYLGIISTELEENRSRLRREHIGRT